MQREKSDSMIQRSLMSLCCSNGWSYGVFWRFDPRNSLLLTMEDAYFEEQMGVVIDNMLLQVHILGNGIVGQAAFTKRHRWMYDVHCGGENHVDSTDIHNILEYDSEFHFQFSSGIQTIAVISVEPQGVVQFGSSEKIPERMEFVNQTKKLFREIARGDGLILSENEPSSSNSDICGPSGFLASLISSGNSSNSNLKPIHCNGSKEFPGTSSVNLALTSLLESDHEKMKPFMTNSFQTPCTSSWSNQDSSLTSFESFLADPNSLVSSRSLISPCTFEDLFQSSDFFTTAFSKSTPLDNISEQFVPSLEQSNNTLHDELSQAMRFTSGAEVLNDIPVSHPAISVQSSLTETPTSDRKEKCSNGYIVGNDLFGSLEVDLGCGVLAQDCLDDLLMPFVSDSQLGFSTTDTLERISGENHVGSVIAPQNGLFSKLGLEQILNCDPQNNSSSCVRSSFEDELFSMTKRRKIGSSSVSGNMNNLNGINNLETKKEFIPKLEVDSWIGDRCSMNGRVNVVSQPKKDEPVKVNKKKAKPGTRPRPKDRQQIQDRVAELRELIPNGVKLSIDSLLAQTIKHLLFLQSVTKHADKLKQVDKPKMIHQENKEDLKDRSKNGASGVTWACELGAPTMLCPLVVEDLSVPGQMLIEMLCEEGGLFLEIVDIIRGFGLTILKGVMEVREKKIWARFIVEAEESRCVSRVEIFMALVQLLEPSATSGINTRNHLGNTINGGTSSSLFNNFKQPVVPLPLSMANTLL